MMKGQNRLSVIGYRLSLLLGLLLLFSLPEARASSPFKLTGEVGSYLESYQRKEGKTDRPDFTARLYFRPTVSFWGMSFPFEFMLSTEETRVRQPFNHLSLSPRFGPVTLHIGDYYPEFSEYTLRGEFVRGGGIDLRPGGFRLSLVSGQNRRATKGDNPTYARNLSGVKLGLGKKGGFLLDLNLLKVRDEPKSLDSTGVEPPQENLVGGVSLEAKFGKVSLGGEFAASAYTRDMHSSEFSSEKIPSAVSKLFKPRHSTSVDYAYNIKLGLRLSGADLKGGYAYIGPGYTSLGLSSLANDRQKIDFSSRFGLLQNKIAFSGNFSTFRDNLTGQKDYTTRQNSFSLNLSWRPAASFSLTPGYIFTGMKNDASDDTSQVDNSVTGYNLNAGYNYSLAGNPQAVVLSYSYQTSRDRNKVNPHTDFDSQNFRLMLNHNLGKGLSLSPNFGYMQNKSKSYADTAVTSTTTKTYLYGLGVNHRAYRGKLSNSLNLSSNQQKGSKSQSLAEFSVCTCGNSSHRSCPQIQWHPIGFTMLDCQSYSFS